MPALKLRSLRYTHGLFHLIHLQAAFLVECHIGDLAGLNFVQILDAGIATISRHLTGWLTILLDVSKHRQKPRRVCRVAGLDHNIQHQAAAPRTQINLMPILNIPGALDDDVAVFFKHTDNLVICRDFFFADTRRSV